MDPKGYDEEEETVVAGYGPWYQWYVNYRLNLQTSLATNLERAVVLFEGLDVVDMGGLPYNLRGLPRLVIQYDLGE